MAAKVNKMVKISLKDGSMGPNGSGLTIPHPGSVLGGGTRMSGSSAGFKTRNDKGGGKEGMTAGTKTNGYGAARGVQKNSGNTGGDQY
ncbi:hypothetical protein [Bradyrhizobium sp.]|jgi:hypothetical protein